MFPYYVAAVEEPETEQNYNVATAARTQVLSSLS